MAQYQITGTLRRGTQGDELRVRRLLYDVGGNQLERFIRAEERLNTRIGSQLPDDRTLLLEEYEVSPIAGSPSTWEAVLTYRRTPSSSAASANAPVEVAYAPDSVTVEETRDVQGQALITVSLLFNGAQITRSEQVHRVQTDRPTITATLTRWVPDLEEAKDNVYRLRGITNDRPWLDHKRDQWLVRGVSSQPDEGGYRLRLTATLAVVNETLGLDTWFVILLHKGAFGAVPDDAREGREIRQVQMYRRENLAAAGWAV